MFHCSCTNRTGSRRLLPHFKATQRPSLIPVLERIMNYTHASFSLRETQFTCELLVRISSTVSLLQCLMALMVWLGRARVSRQYSTSIHDYAWCRRVAFSMVHHVFIHSFLEIACLCMMRFVMCRLWSPRIGKIVCILGEIESRNYQRKSSQSVHYYTDTNDYFLIIGKYGLSIIITSRVRP